MAKRVTFEEGKDLGRSKKGGDKRTSIALTAVRLPAIQSKMQHLSPRETLNPLIPLDTNPTRLQTSKSGDSKSLLHSATDPSSPKYVETPTSRGTYLPRPQTSIRPTPLCQLTTAIDISDLKYSESPSASRKTISTRPKTSKTRDTQSKPPPAIDTSDFESHLASVSPRPRSSKARASTLPGHKLMSPPATEPSELSSGAPQPRKSDIIKVKVQSNAYVTPDDPVSILLPEGSAKEVRLYYKNCELDPDLTFAEQGVVDGSEILAEPVLTLHCHSPRSEVELQVTGADSIAKVVMDAAAAASLDVSQHYDLLAGAARLPGDSTVRSAGLDSLSSLQLQPTIERNSLVRSSGPGTLIQAIFQTIAPGSVVIITDKTIQELQQLGFKRHILDPIMFYKMTLVQGTAKDEKTESNFITVFVEVVSWKSLILRIDKQKTVLQMKQQLAESTKVPESKHAIVYNWQSLEDSSTLESYGIADGCTVFAICTGEDSYLFLPLEYFHPGGDFDYTKYTSPTYLGKRGGQVYFPPCGWHRYGLKVSGLFGDNTWLGMRSAPGEWIVSYHGTSLPSAVCTVSDLKKRSAFACGRGVYSFPRVEDAEAYAVSITWESATYKMVFMDRVNPDALKKTGGEGQGNLGCYVAETDRDIRPYGILLKPT